MSSPPHKARSSEQRGGQEWTSRYQPEPGPTLFRSDHSGRSAWTPDTSVEFNVGFDRETVANLSPKTSAHHPPPTVTMSSANNIYFQLCCAPFVSTVTDRTRVDISWRKRAARVSSCG
jgi:hypothetical protein